MLRSSVPLKGSSNEPLRPRGGRSKGRRRWNGDATAEGYLIKSQSNEITRLPKICFPPAPVNPAPTICSPHVLDSPHGRRRRQPSPGDRRKPRRRARGLSLRAEGVPCVPGAPGARSRRGDVHRRRGAGDAGAGGDGAGGAGPAAGGPRAPGLGRARRDRRPPAGRGARMARAARLAPEGRAPPPSRPPDGDGGLVPAERLGAGGDRRKQRGPGRPKKDGCSPKKDQAVPKKDGPPQKRTEPSQKRTGAPQKRTGPSQKGRSSPKKGPSRPKKGRCSPKKGPGRPKKGSGCPEEPLITPALFSQPSTHPSGEKRERPSCRKRHPRGVKIP